ncbi:MAG: FmdB family zinc ribbon protein [Chloroflexota bacterium]
MPLYEYKCANCGTQFERLVRMAGADGQVECPNCGSAEAKRLVSLFGWSGATAGLSGADCAPSLSGG